MFEAVLWFLLGAAVTNAGEWFIHKYILHALGKHKNSLWAYHWHEHHAVCDKNNMLDEGNRRLKLQWNPQNKELLTLARILLSQLLFIQSLSNQFKNYNFNRRYYSKYLLTPQPTYPIPPLEKFLPALVDLCR